MRDFLINVFEPPLPGDYNHNGVVDAADFVDWRNGGPLDNDPTAGVQDPGDYDVWREHFGQTAGNGAGASSTATVPEPASLVLLFAGTLALLSCRRPKV
jgi:hypothetical protein